MVGFIGIKYNCLCHFVCRCVVPSKANCNFYSINKRGQQVSVGASIYVSNNNYSSIFYRAVSSCMTTVFFPILPFLLEVAVLAISITIFMYIASLGDAQYRIIKKTADCICEGPAAAYMVNKTNVILFLCTEY